MGRKDVVGRGDHFGTEEESIGEELERGDFDADRELVGHVRADGGEESTGVGEDDEGAGLGDLEVDRLAGGRVGGICEAEVSSEKGAGVRGTNR